MTTTKCEFSEKRGLDAREISLSLAGEEKTLENCSNMRIVVAMRVICVIIYVFTHAPKHTAQCVWGEWYEQVPVRAPSQQEKKE